MIQIAKKEQTSATTAPKVKKTRKNHGCLFTILILGVLYIGGIAWAAYTSGKGTEVKENSVYKINMEGVLVEQGEADNPFAEMMSKMQTFGGNYEETVGLDDLLRNIRLAGDNDKIKGILLYGGSLSMGPAQAKTLRDALLQFKAKGKWIMAYAPNYGGYNYYVASVADRICINPTGSITWHGGMAAKLYYTRLLEKIGVEMQILKVGTFKSAVEPYFRTSMSEADKQQTMRFITGIWDEMVSAVAESRSLSCEQLNDYADEVLELQDAEKYIAYGMADTLIYEQSVDSILYQMMDTKANILTTGDMCGVKVSENSANDKIAIVYADGGISDDSETEIGGKQFVKLLGKVGKDENVKAVVLRVNSPGGSADASEQIWHAEQLLKQAGLPIVVSMSTYAASGGYYISCAADYIYAEPTTLTGSIGIFGLIPSYKGIREKIGLDIDGIQTNKHSLMMTNMIYKGMNRDEQGMMQAMIERGYDLFTRRCAEGRGMSQADIKAIAEGRVWLGADAVKIGLVDSLGNINDAIAKAAELAGLEEYQLVSYPEKTDFPTQMIEELYGQSEEEKLIAKVKKMTKAPQILAEMEEIILN